MNIYENMTVAFSRDDNYMMSDGKQFELDQRRLAVWVGLIAMLLPSILFLSQTFGTAPRESISHYFYVPGLGGIFVISLAFIGTFLVAYKGVGRWQNRLATLAGWCAFATALFPTEGKGFEEIQNNGERTILMMRVFTSESGDAAVVGGKLSEMAFNLNNYSKDIHLTAAAILFIFLAIYSLFIFTQPVEGVSRNEGKLTTVKTARNTIYYLTGIIIIVCLAMIGAHKLNIIQIDNWDDARLTFWFESIALFAFGIAWMVKGRFYGWFLND